MANLAAGYYYVNAGPPSYGLNLRSTPSIAIPPITGYPDGTRVHATGVNQNEFVQVDQPRPGWMATQFLSSTQPQGVAIGSSLPARTLELRTLLAAWVAKNPQLGVGFGTPQDFLPTQDADNRQREAVGAFQANNGISPATGLIDDRTEQALRAWGANQPGIAAPPPPPAQLPVVTTEKETPPTSTTSTATAAGGGAMLLVLVVGGLLILSHEKRKRRRAA